MQNLWLAFFFNGIGVPFATTGLVHPSWVMIAMALSVSAVLLNSFGGRLLRPWQAAAPQHRDDAVEQPGSSDDVRSVTFAVPSIHCGACVETIEAYLTTEPGVARVEGDIPGKSATVTFQSGAIDHETLRAMLGQIGYSPE